MLLLSDGTVMGAADGVSSNWYRLTPDSHGSYVNGTWTALAGMHFTRLYFSSDVLRDGRVFVAGGEYGTGTTNGEVFDPVSNTWTILPDSGQSFSDSISKILPDGTVLVAPVGPKPSGTTIRYDPVSNTWLSGGRLFRGSYQDEASWVKLPDDSILTIDPFGTNSERYIPSLTNWINDANVSVPLYDPYGFELGAGFLLADGRAFFLGAIGHTAFYTPTGGTNQGVWTQGPDIPNGQGTPDAPAAMMVNGKILCVFSPAPTSTNHFPSPTSFYEFDPVANSFTNISAPSSGVTNQPTYVSRMLVLPDGTVLYSPSSSQLYVYAPGGAPLAAGKPAISGISFNMDGSFHLQGTLLNGISEGAAYGDDVQEDSNYPLVRLTNSSGNVFYARTHDWSSTSVMTANRPVTTEFTLPTNLVTGAFSLAVVANGNSSDPVTFTTTTWNGTANSNWDLTTLNWRKSGAVSNYNQSDFVIFDDSLASNAHVNLTTALTPGGVQFNNSRTNYFLSGTGSLNSAGGLSKSGSASVTLSETGGDTLTGGVGIFAGTLILDNANGVLSGGVNIGVGASLQCGNDDANGALPAGNVTNNGALIFNQTSDLIVTNPISGAGTFTKNDSNTLSLTSVGAWRGSTLINAGTLALAGNGSISSSTNMILAAGASLDASGRSDQTLTLANGQTLQGSGAVQGNLSVAPGTSLIPGTNSTTTSTLSISSNLTLQGLLSMKLSPANATNDVLFANSITYGGALLLTNISGTPLTAGANFRLFSASNYTGAFSAISPVIPAPGLAWNTNTLTMDGTLGVIFTPGDTWSGVVNGNWDTNTANWLNGGASSNYTQGDAVTFDDAVIGATNVVLTTTLAPASLTFNNALSNYLFNGSGRLAGNYGLTKNLQGTVTLAETGGDNFTGGITVNNGTLILDNANSAMTGKTTIGAGATLQCGINDTNGYLTAGSVALNGRLVFSHTNNLVVTNLISGFGSLIKSNSNALMVSQNNANWTGAVTVAQGLLQIGATNALGRGTNVPITVASGATLDVNGIVGTNALVVSGSGLGGNGAIVNNNLAVSAFPALAFLTLAGNTTIGGSNRWDLRPAGTSPDTVGSAFAGLSTGGQPLSLTKVGPNFIGLVSAAVDVSLANINVQAGTLDIEGDITSLGNPVSTLTVSSNATLEFWNLGFSLNKVILLNDGAIVFNGSGANLLSGPMTLNTNSAGGPGNIIFNMAGSYLYCTGPIGGPGNLLKTGSAIFYITANNTYKGSTLVNAGTLSLWTSGSISNSPNIVIASGATFDAVNRTDKTFTLTTGQTLQGNGKVTGFLVANPGSIVMPGTNATTIGALTVASNVALQGTVVMKLNPGAGTNDVLYAYGLTNGGTLSLTNISGTPLAAGNSFRLFAATNYSGAFSAIVPSIPGPGLAWNTAGLGVNGVLSVSALDFAANPTIGLAPLTVSFTNLSSPASYLWDFGDGNTSTNANPVNTYLNAGGFSVRLTAMAASGTNTLVRTNYIVVTNPPPPAANFVASPTSGLAPLPVVFTNLTTGNASSFSWVFGDGNTSTNANPANTYSNAGSYTVSLSAVGQGGTNTFTRTNYVVVTNPPPPVANFAAIPTSGLAPLSVAFTNLTTGNVSSFNWTFGDGNTSASGNPVNTYSNAGMYTVSLAVVGPGGTNSLVRTNYIVVTNAPPQGVIAQWTFNSSPPDGNPSTGTTAPAYGSGTATLVGGVTAIFTNGDAVADPSGASDNSAWATTSYPSRMASNKTAGVQFNSSTAGLKNIRVSWSQWVDSSASKYLRLQYTTNGAAFVDLPTATTMTNSGVFESKSNSLAAIPTVENNPSFGFRLLTEFESTATGSGQARYVTVGGSSGYSPNGQVLFDMVTIYGDRISVAAMLASVAFDSSNGFQFALTGSPGANYAILASTDLTVGNWISLATNAAPFTFADTNALLFPRRFFRAVLVP